MSHQIRVRLKTIVQRAKAFFDKTDIYALVFAPPTIGFSVYLIIFFIFEFISEKPVSESFIYLGGGVVFLLTCIGGLAEIYKKEMPFIFGKVIKGSLAIISGAIILILMVVSSIAAFIYGIRVLLR
ncbi:MAG: hypothetical protein JNK32_06010 [Anaerolineales bacterium]|nr:hypothetical protein [Anaerolineales bacterium]